MSSRVLISETQRGTLKLSGEAELVYVGQGELSHGPGLLKTAQLMGASGVYLSAEELAQLLALGEQASGAAAASPAAQQPGMIISCTRIERQYWLMPDRVSGSVSLMNPGSTPDVK